MWVALGLRTAALVEDQFIHIIRLARAQRNATQRKAASLTLNQQSGYSDFLVLSLSLSNLDSPSPRNH